MDVREKLAEIVKKAAYSSLPSNTEDFHLNMFVTNLLSHGVTVQEWISVKDRLPTIYDADADNCVLAIHKASNKRYYHWRSVANNPFDFTHWMKTPQPPKGE